MPEEGRAASWVHRNLALVLLATGLTVLGAIVYMVWRSRAADQFTQYLAGVGAILVQATLHSRSGHGQSVTIGKVEINTFYINPPSV